MVRAEMNIASVVPFARRPKKMRARRLRVEDLKLGSVDVSFSHPQVGTVSGRAEDLSLHGLLVVVDGAAAHDSVFLPGDRLEAVRITCDAGLVYSGTALVRRLATRGNALTIGVELESSGLDLARLYRSGTRRDFAKRWEAAKREGAFAEIKPAFKVWVADLLAELKATADFLESEEDALKSEDRQTRDEAEREYLAVIAPDIAARLEEARQQLASLVGDLSDAEHAAHRAYCAHHLGPYLKRSPFLRRALEKPLGYAGDYEMMNMLYRDPAEGDGLFGKALNVCFTNEPAAIANKNRISYIGGLIRDALARHPGRRVRIASLGCGPAREVEALLTAHPELGKRLDVALIDQEERAIAHCERRLAPLAASTGARVQLIRESLRTLIAKDSLMEKLGARDLIYSAGLFDYLDDRVFSRVLSVLFGGLSEDGAMAIGNVAAHNPSRWVMEYFSEWFLIHRSEEDLLRLTSEIQPQARSVTVSAEPSGINLFLHIRR